MPFENHDAPFRSAQSPYPTMPNLAEIGRKIEARSSDTGVSDEQRLVRAELALLAGIKASPELADRAVLGAVLAKWERDDFGVPGRGLRLARLDVAGNRILLPMILGPMNGRKRNASLEAFRVNREERDAVLDLDPPLVGVITRIPADVTTASRSSTAPPASEAAVAMALEVMTERGEVLWPAAVTAHGFEVFHITYALDRGSR